MTTEQQNAPAEAGANVYTTGAGTPLMIDVSSVGRSTGAIAPGDVAELWASDQITGLLPDDVQAPVYGSAEWALLPSTDPRRIAAVIEAAERWRRYGDPEDVAAWLAEVAAPRPPLHTLPTGEELAARRQPRPAHQLRATPGWPPITVPGGQGRQLYPWEAAA